MSQAALEQAVWEPHKPTEADIRAKMRYRMKVKDAFSDGFCSGLQTVLRAALGVPHTEYWERFQGACLSDLYWYFRAPRAVAHAVLIEDRWRQEIQTFREDAAEMPLYHWGVLSGKLASLRWLVEPDRRVAEEQFPRLDSFVRA